MSKHLRSRTVLVLVLSSLVAVAAISVSSDAFAQAPSGRPPGDGYKKSKPPPPPPPPPHVRPYTPRHGGPSAPGDGEGSTNPDDSKKKKVSDDCPLDDPFCWVIGGDSSYDF